MWSFTADFLRWWDFQWTAQVFRPCVTAQVSPRRASCFAARSFTAVVFVCKRFHCLDLNLFCGFGTTGCFVPWIRNLVCLFIAYDFVTWIPSHRIASRWLAAFGATRVVPYLKAMLPFILPIVCLWRRSGGVESCGFVFCQSPYSRMSASDPALSSLNLSSDLVVQGCVGEVTSQRSRNSSSGTPSCNRSTKIIQGGGSGRRSVAP